MIKHNETITEHVGKHMRGPRFKEKLSEYFGTILKNIPVLPKVNTSYKNIELYEFKTHDKNGKALKHKYGEYYAIAIFNCISKKSVQKITEFIKSSECTIVELKDFVEKQKLIKYVSGNTKAYLQWKDGDIGVAHMIFNTKKGEYCINGFANHSAIERNSDIRIKPIQSKINI